MAQAPRKERQSDEYSSLLAAIKNGDKDNARKLLLDQAQVNPRILFTTPLHLAIVKFDDTEIVELLLDNGADISIKNKEQKTPLDIAIDLNKEEIVELLLEKGAFDEDLVDEDMVNRTIKGGNLNILIDLVNHNSQAINVELALDLALQSAHLDILHFILSHYYTKMTNKWLPKDLILKVHAKYERCFELLVLHGFTLNPSDKDHFDFMYAAVENEYITMIHEFLKLGINLDQINTKTGLTLLHLACIRQKTDIVKLLLEHGADTSVLNKRSSKIETDKECRVLPACTALFMAVDRSSFTITKLLLENGAVINDKSQPNLLKHAISRGYKEIIIMLLDFGADINDTTYNGSTPLHSAIKKRSVHDRFSDCKSDHSSTINKLHAEYEIIELLLKKGANINAVDKNNKTPLHYACEYGRFDIINILLDYTADVTVKDSNGQTPLHIISTSESSICDNPELLEKIYKRFLAMNVDINAEDSDGQTPLFTACYYKNESIVRILLKHRANVNCPDILGRTPMHIIIDRGTQKTEIFKMLYANNADLTAVDIEGNNILHAAAVSFTPQILDLIDKLIIDINARNLDGCTCLHVAARSGFVRMVRASLKKGADINIKSIKNRTVFHLAAEAMFNFSASFVDTNLYRRNRGTVGADEAAELFNRNTDRYREIFTILHAHVIKLQTAKLFVSKDVLDSMGICIYEHARRSIEINDVDDFGINLFQLEGECNEEIRILKKENFYSTTFFNLLTSTAYEISKFAKNDAMLETLQSRHYSRKFPLYKDIIINRYKEGLARNELSVIIKICDFSSIFPPLPLICIDKILNYLGNEDVKVLINMANVQSLE